jgi:hypothetical protein
MSDEDARGLYFEEAPQLPIACPISRWNDWQSGLYLDIDRSVSTRLKMVTGSIAGLRDRGAVREGSHHISLFRKRGFRPAAFATNEFQRVRQALAQHDWGAVQIVGIRVKVLGSDYDDARDLFTRELDT